MVTKMFYSEVGENSKKVKRRMSLYVLEKTVEIHVVLYRIEWHFRNSGAVAAKSAVIILSFALEGSSGTESAVLNG